MTFTINTDTKTIQIIGSFTYQEFDRLQRSLASTEWSDYKYEQPVEKEYIYPPYWLQQPTYPLQPYYTTGDPLPPNPTITCNGGNC